MANSNVVVRKLAALESLGGVTDICTDKTGTLTTSKMVASQIGFALPNEKSGKSDKQSFGVERAATAFEPFGRLYPIQPGQNATDAPERYFEQSEQMPPHVVALTTAAALCNVAAVAQLPDPKDEKKTIWTATAGDPTEVALQVLAMKLGMGKSDLAKADPNATDATAASTRSDGRYTFKQEFPFDSTIKRATFAYRDSQTSQHIVFAKGAVEGVLDRCTRTIALSDDGKSTAEVKLTPAHRDEILGLMERMASQGLRVLAFGHRSLGNSVHLDKAAAAASLRREDAEQDLTFLGLAGLYDPPRPETPGAIADCHMAGITVRMLTGDHVATARAIAREIGILDGTEGKSAVMTAAEFDALTDEQLDALPDLPLVVARCSPQSKVRMISAGRRRGRHLAMTGDGINDAPALKRAEIGIAMGSGTQVARDVASLTLVDDSYASIVKGIKEGRTVFDNIQRFCIVLLVANVGEVILLLIGLAFRDANDDSVFPLSPLAILVVNALSASVPCIALGLEAADEFVMTRAPHDLKAGVFSLAVITDILCYGTTMGVTCLLSWIMMVYRPGLNSAPGASRFAVGCNSEYEPACDVIYEARSAVFVALICQNLFIAWEMLSRDQSFFQIGPVRRLRRNPLLFWSVVFGLAIPPVAIYVPGLNFDIFRHSPLGGVGWAVGISMTAAFILVVELWKLLARRGYWPWLTRVTGGRAIPSAHARSIDSSSVKA